MLHLDRKCIIRLPKRQQYNHLYAILMMRPFIKQILCIHKLNNRLAKQPEWEPEFLGLEHLN